MSRGCRARRRPGSAQIWAEEDETGTGWWRAGGGREEMAVGQQPGEDDGALARSSAEAWRRCSSGGLAPGRPAARA